METVIIIWHCNIYLTFFIPFHGHCSNESNNNFYRIEIQESSLKIGAHKFI